MPLGLQSSARTSVTDNGGVVLRADVATTFVIFGSYFPAWIACVIMGLIAAAAVQVLLRATDMVTAVPLLPIFHLLVVLFGATTSWLILFSAG